MKTRNKPRQLAETAEVLGTLVRNILLKRALHTADPNPKLNFWRIQYGNLMDLAVIDWCKLFGSDDAERQPIHWKNIADNQDSFRSALLKALAMTRKDWEFYWQGMKKYRDFTAAHHDSRRAEIATYPVLDKALDSHSSTSNISSMRCGNWTGIYNQQISGCTRRPLRPSA
jgi:hypothetical protein